MEGRKRKKTGYFILLLLLAAALAACIYLYPVWKAAGILQRHMAAGCFTYELDVQVDKTALEAGQREVLENLAKLTGYDEEAMFRLRVSGTVWEDKIQAMIYPQGGTEPLMELYLSNEVKALNETRPYNTIRSNLIGKYEILEHIMPAEMEAIYMTAEQAEQIFHLDLSAVKSFQMPNLGAGKSAVGYFAVLALASKEKLEQGYRYEISADQAVLRVEITDYASEGNTGTDGEGRGGESPGQVRIQLDLTKPGELAAQQSQLLARLGIELPVRELAMLENISIVMEPGKGSEPEAPDRFMDQKKADLIVEIRDLIVKLADLFTSEESPAQ